MGLNEKFFKSAGGGFVATDNFMPVVYTGNGGTQSITSLNFKPDLVWLKGRDGAPENHNLLDSVRGISIPIFSNLTNGENTSASGLYVTSFNNNGFTITDNAAGNYGINGNGIDYISWNWKAGGAAVLNEDGTIDSQVSANVDAGFSIVSYTGASANQNVGHGLDETPQLIIVKNRDTTGNGWATQSPFSGGADYHMMLNSTQEAKNNVNWIWNDTEPTSSVFSIGENGITNTSGDKYIGYCFHSVAGYQKIGSYTGTAGSFTVYTTDNGASGGANGFRPRFVMIKRVDAAGGNWVIIDEPRGSGSIRIYPNLSSAEHSGQGESFSSTGFSPRPSSTGDTNISGATYLYLAIA